MKTTEAREALIALIEYCDGSGGALHPETAGLAQLFLQMLTHLGDQQLAELKLVNRKENIGSLLIKFGELSKFGKSEWIDLIHSYGLELPLNPRDSARDVMGRLARYLREHPDALKSVAATDSKNVPRGSRSSKRKRPLAENLQDTLNRLLDE